LFWLERLARWFAVLGGVFLITITLITSASVISRNWLGLQFVGDFELTGAFTAVSIACFFPWCQLTHSNIIVDFFTSGTLAGTRATLDRWGTLMVAMVMAFLTWRTTVGGFNAWGNHSSSMLLGLPDWLVFLGMVPALALTCAVAVGQTCAPGYVLASDTPQSVPGDRFST
jgi:hypothetical protein